MMALFKLACFCPIATLGLQLAQQPVPVPLPKEVQEVLGFTFVDDAPEVANASLVAGDEVPEMVQQLWNQTGADNSKCASSEDEEHEVASRDECQAEAVEKGHRYYHFWEREASLCATSDACDSPSVSLEHPWKIYQAPPQRSVWIVSAMRSASTTVLSMISATYDDNREGGDVFSLHEPCHVRDTYSERLTKVMYKNASGCSDLVLQLSKCKFNEVVDLNGWKNPHSTNSFTKTFSNDVARKSCKKANTIALKTVGALNLAEMTWALEANEDMKIIELIRDPRGIYASRKGPYDGHLDPETLDRDCEAFANNLDVQHPRIHRIVFDDLVKFPMKTVQDLYMFLDRPFTPAVVDWVEATFNAGACGEHGITSEGRHNDCHSDSASVATKWQTELSNDIKQRFENNSDCVRVSRAYNFPLS